MRSLQVLIAAVLFSLITALWIDNSADILSIQDFIKFNQMYTRVGDISHESNDRQKEQLDGITRLVVQKLQDPNGDGGDEKLADYINQISDGSPGVKCTHATSEGLCVNYYDELLSNIIEQMTVRDKQKLTTEAPFDDADEQMANSLQNKQIFSAVAPFKDVNKIANDAIENMLNIESPEEISSMESKGRP